MRLTEPYAPRAVSRLGIREHAGWRMKVYGIAYGVDFPEQVLIDAAVEVALGRLPLPAVTADRYGVGFLGVHQGRGENFAWVDWWARENELHHHVWFSAQESPAALRAWRPDDPIACAWDLSVIAFERASWVRHVLARPDAPDLDGYLAEQLHGQV
jgi:hypothetical protein